MTLRTGRRARSGSRRGGGAGFTLIELILVMALLLIAGALVYPTLQRFFEGRVLDAEARRMLALTRYGQSRAVSEGVPMVMWLDVEEGSYGLALAAGYGNDDPRQRRFELDDDLTLEVSEPRAGVGGRMGSRGGVGVAGLGVGGVAMAPVATAGVRLSREVATIEFLPDGYISLRSPEQVMIREGEGEGEACWLVQDTNRLGYVLATQEPYQRAR